MRQRDPSRLVVLISGNGSNLQAILDACGQSPTPLPAENNGYAQNTPAEEPRPGPARPLPARVVAVFSNQPDAFGLARARAAGVPAHAFPRLKELDRAGYDALLAEQVAAYKPDWVVLAGWMRLLSSAFLSRFPARVLNLHPALPGAFPGTHAIERAYEASRQGLIDHTGVMVHLVPDEGVDSGPVLAQEEVPVDPQEDLASLEARIHQVEHRLLVSVIKKLTEESC